MTENQRKIETVAWILTVAAPLLCMWIPSAILLGAPAGDTLSSMLVSSIFPAAPFLVLSVFVHVMNRTSRSESVTTGIAFSLIATLVSVLLFYIYFWLSVFNSIGVDFRGVFALMLSPLLISLVIPVAYIIGTHCAKGTTREESTEQGV